MDSSHDDDGAPVVVLIGGFGVPPVVLAPLARWLRRAGWSPAIAPVGLNVRCGEETVRGLEPFVTASAFDGRVTLVGHSRGGQLARVLAVRHPEAVARVVTVTTPWTVGPPSRPGVELGTTIVRALRRRGLDVMASVECASGPCCAQFRDDIARVPEMPWTVLWSSRDRIARDDAAPPAGCTNAVDIETSHFGAVTSTRGQRAVADALDWAP